MPQDCILGLVPIECEFANGSNFTDTEKCCTNVYNEIEVNCN